MSVNPAAPDTGSIGQKLFQEFISVALPAETFEVLTGNHSYATRRLLESGLEKRIRIAWTKPLSHLSCAEVRMLVGQKLGLEWLAGPVALFVTSYPQAECDLYEGDITINALVAWRELLQQAPVETERMVRTDLGFLHSEPDANTAGSLTYKALQALEQARAAISKG